MAKKVKKPRKVKPKSDKTFKEKPEDIEIKQPVGKISTREIFQEFPTETPRKRLIKTMIK